MALPNTMLKQSQVTDILSANGGNVNSDMSSLFQLAANINPWSKWKPVESDVDTMTIAELDRLNYGIAPIESNTIEGLVQNIDATNGRGYMYNRATTKFRLGDFRNYNPIAVVPCDKTYLESEEIRIGGVTPNNHSSYERDCAGAEALGTETQVGWDDIYDFTTPSGEALQVRRGAYITNGVNSEWYTGKFYWWTPSMQLFAGTEVTIYEFYTNVIKTPDLYNHTERDRFYALPLPRYKKLVSGEQPAGSKTVGVNVRTWFNASDFLYVTFNVFFDATSDVYTGGQINNVWVKLSHDAKGNQVIARYQIAEHLVIARGERSTTFRNILLNEGGNQDVWLTVSYDNKVQVAIQPAPPMIDV